MYKFLKQEKHDFLQHSNLIQKKNMLTICVNKSLIKSFKVEVYLSEVKN